MKFIVKKERQDTSGNSMSKSQSHMDFYNRDQKTIETAELDLRNQKFKKMENQIFGEIGPLMTLPKSQLNRMNTIQNTDEREKVATYPKLR